MTKPKLATLGHAIALLQSLIDQPHAVDSTPRSSGVTKFVDEYLAHDPAADISCAEAWGFYCEVAASGDLKPMRQAEFYRRLPAAVEFVHGAKKCHAIRRDGRTVRGFKSVGIRMNTPSNHGNHT